MLSPVGVISGVASIIDYFRPSKSPYLLVIVAGIGGVVLLCSDAFVTSGRFFWIAIPIYIVLVILTHYSWRSVDSDWKDQKKSEAEGQLKFSRAVCIICGLGCLVFAAYREVHEDEFVLIYLTSLFQIIVFVVYAAARLRIEEPTTSTNYFQMALVTSAFLVGATYCIYGWAQNTRISSSASTTARFVQMMDDDWIGPGASSREYLISAIVFYACWAWCQAFWLKRLKDIIHISISPEEKHRLRSESGSQKGDVS